MFNQINDFFNCNSDENRIVFYNHESGVSFAQYKNDVAKYANYFSGLSDKEIVVYIPDNLYLFYGCFMALLQANKDIILPALLTAENAKTLIESSHTLLTDKFNSLDGFNIIDLKCDDDANWEFKDVNNGWINFFTSGSTGTPKRIRKQFKMLVAEVAFHCENQKYLIDEKTIMISSVAPYHMYGLLWRFLFPLASGIRADLDIVFTPEELQHKQSIYDNILFATTPSFLDGITRYQNQYTFQNNCIGIYSSGSLLDTKTSQSAYNMFGVSPFEIFGSTETGGVASRQQINGQNWDIFAPVKVELTENQELLITSDFSCKNPYLMSDMVQMVNERQFLLRGRSDRMVKIAEERVSLPEMEEKLCNYEFIEKSYVSTLNKNDRTIICAMITLTDTGKRDIIQYGRHNFIFNLKQHLLKYFPNVVLPKKIRIVNDIPVNTQGKYIKADIATAFESNVAEPIMQNVIKTNSEFIADMVFLGDSAYFTGHFVGCPVLPGVIQIHFVIYFIKKYFHITPNDYHILKLKFSNLILPNTMIHFELKRISENEFEFSYSDEKNKYSNGKILIKD